MNSEENGGKRGILKGPRYRTLEHSLNRSISALDRPLRTDEIELGWNDSVRKAMLEGYRQVLKRVSRGLAMRANDYHRWVLSLNEMIDPRKTDPLSDEALAGDNAVVSLLNAQGLLTLCDDIISYLSEPSVAMLPGEWRDEWCQLLLRIRESLLLGRYLSMIQFRAWDALTMQLGIVRSTTTNESGSSGYFDSNSGPRGIPKSVITFDRSLVDVVQMDKWAKQAP
jgi:hypothetical protein